MKFFLLIITFLQLSCAQNIRETSSLNQDQDQKKVISVNENDNLIGQKIYKNAIIEINQKSYIYLNEKASGKYGIVYKLLGEDGKFYALKIVKKDTPKKRLALKNEITSFKELEEHQAEYPKIISKGNEYLLKEWVFGLRADAWIVLLVKNYISVNHKTSQELKKTFLNLSRKNVYFSDVTSRKNIIWTGKAWSIVDPGEIEYINNKKELLNKYFTETISRLCKGFLYNKTQCHEKLKELFYTR